MSSKISLSLLKTLVYADVFDYPLSFDELFRFLVSDKKVDKNRLTKLLRNLLSKKIQKKENFFFLKGREETVSIRKRREIHSKRKIDLAKRAVRRLSLIPSIQFIGISGALALKNSEKDDDIDLFIITERKKLWLTRFLCMSLLRILGKARKRNEKDVSDKICVNMFVSEEKLTLLKARQDLYSAHEIVQLLPLFDRENTYRRFLGANRWVGGFLANALDRVTTQLKTRNHTDSILSVFLRLVLRPSALENLAKKFQLWYMKDHFTKETISDSLLAFHPKDYRREILRSFERRFKKYL